MLLAVIAIPEKVFSRLEDGREAIQQSRIFLVG
jgi:hypothetical protein